MLFKFLFGLCFLTFSFWGTNRVAQLAVLCAADLSVVCLKPRDIVHLNSFAGPQSQGDREEDGISFK
eukprot:4279813-Amphidinium_carterae.2